MRLLGAPAPKAAGLRVLTGTVLEILGYTGGFPYLFNRSYSTAGIWYQGSATMNSGWEFATCLQLHLCLGSKAICFTGRGTSIGSSSKGATASSAGLMPPCSILPSTS